MDIEDARFLLMMAAVLLTGAGLAIAAAARPFRHRADAGFGFRWVKRR